MLSNLVASILVARRLREYRPQQVNVSSVLDWIGQFQKRHHSALRRILKALQFVGEKQMTTEMRDLNETLLVRLASKGVTPSNVIYVSFDDAGSSSASVLNLIRNACLLQNRGCKFIAAKDTLGLHKTTRDLGKGAIVFVDDFIGTGNQFCDEREFLADYVVGTFSEFLLAHTICEEGLNTLGRRNAVEPVSVKVHGRTDRPLHEFSRLLPEPLKQELREYCLLLSPKSGLGYQRLATTVVYYSNSPNTIPLLLRGARSQKLLRGVIPRTTDLDHTQLRMK